LIGSQRLIAGFLIFSVSYASHLICHEGWRENENKCYFFSTDTKSWLEAQSFCLSQRSNLMSIQDIHERVRLQTHTLWIRTQIDAEIYWFGLNDRIAENVWEWADGDTYNEHLSFWAPGQPDNWGAEPGEDCGQVLGGSYGQWNDENCNVKRKYICKHVNCKSTSYTHCLLMSHAQVGCS
uniref:C-type lectin domain-containing protein n=1 Tax=Labrus bergylta TaxID=56723 RepID=A0A3Q3FQH5_9LABR